MKLKDNEMMYRIFGCMMKVHASLGFGFLESAYGDALEVEFSRQNIPYIREDEIVIHYDDVPLKTRYRADFTCFERRVIVEIKAIKCLSKVEWAQVLHYLKATQIQFGLLVNFGQPHLQYDTFDLNEIRQMGLLDAADNWSVRPFQESSSDSSNE